LERLEKMRVHEGFPEKDETLTVEGDSRLAAGGNGQGERGQKRHEGVDGKRSERGRKVSSTGEEQEDRHTCLVPPSEKKVSTAWRFPVPSLQMKVPSSMVPYQSWKDC
jgi:hypothetical protein